MSWKEKRIKIDKEIKSYIVPILREKGFKGSYPHFQRKLDTYIQIIGFQFSQFGADFYIEIGTTSYDGVDIYGGKHIPAEKVKFYQAKNRKRIGKQPFSFENEKYSDVIQDIINSLPEIDAWWIELSKKGKI
jgi:hypothetical protein